MREVLSRLLASGLRRSTGLREKRWAYRVQTASAFVFAPIALTSIRRAPLLSLLFASEAVGQLLLAADGRRSAERGDAVVVYFRTGPLGASAQAVLLFASTVRYAMAAQALDVASTMALVPGVLTLALLRVPELRADLVGGGSIIVSALALGCASAWAGCPLAAGAQLAYAALLAIGLFALEPWLAEVINIPVFASAALGWAAAC